MFENVINCGPIQKARFVERPNRFLVRCRTDSGRTVMAFLPNPGRLWELLHPDCRLYLTSPGGRTGKEAARKTEQTVLAVERDGEPIFLHTHWTNRVARWLIQRGCLPGFEDASLIRSEVPHGRSRFDFLLQRRRTRIYLEVKSVTLFGNRVAMFPDAVTERGRRHLLELAAMTSRGVQTAVLLLVHTIHVDWFMPDYHTDLAFSQTLLDVRHRVRILPVAIQWNAELAVSTRVKPLAIPWRLLQREIADRGSYLLILRLDRATQITVGRLGSFRFRAGYYLYVGSAMRHLSRRLARHARRRKKLHWHVDYLRQAAASCTALAIRSSRREECQVARMMARQFAPGPDRFGASDCHCSTHLFWHPTDPLDSADFHTLLQQLRMRDPMSARRRPRQ